MNKLQFLLEKLGEEAVEVAHIASKIKQYGMFSDNNGQLTLTNKEQLHKELDDFNALVEMLNSSFDLGYTPNTIAIREKKSRVYAGMNTCISLGTLGKETPITLWQKDPEPPLPVNQTEYGRNNNSMEACIATILEIPLDQVPRLAPEGQPNTLEYSLAYHDNLKNYLASQGLEMVDHSFTEPSNNKFKALTKHLYYIVSGLSNRDFRHHVVFYNGDMYHNPHEQRVPITPEWIHIIRPIKPKEPAIQVQVGEL